MTKATSSGRAPVDANAAKAPASVVDREPHRRVPLIPPSAPNFILAAPLDRIPAGASLAVALGQVRLTLFNAQGVVYATEECCLRCGAALVDATLCDGRIACTSCGWEYVLSDGSVRGLASLRLLTYPVRIVNAIVEVGMGTREPP